MSEWWSKLWGRWQPEPGDPVEALEAAYRNRRPANYALASLVEAAKADPGYLNAGRLQRIAECMVLEYPDRLLTLFSKAPIALAGDAGAMLTLYRHLYVSAGASAVDAMRWALRVPTAEARWVCTWNPPIGAKTIAFEVVEQHGDAADVELFGRLLDDEHENGWVRLAAGLALHRRLADSSVAERFLKATLSTPVPLPAQHIALAGPGLIEGLIRFLSHPNYPCRTRAADVLCCFGSAAVPALVEVVTTSTSYHAIENAERALRAIAPEKIEEAHRERQRGSQGLSRAAPPGADAERGLSAPE